MDFGFCVFRRRLLLDRYGVDCVSEFGSVWRKSQMNTSSPSSMDDTLPSSEIKRCDSNEAGTFNCSADEFLLYQLGDSVADLWIAIPFTILYTLIFLAGITGNAAICVVTIQNRLMQTSINYYLFNLAVADTLYLLFGLPFEIHMFWHQYPWPFGSAFCRIRSLVSEACSIVSVLTIVAFTVERYIAICYPLYSYVESNLNRVIRVISLIWLISFISSSPIAYYRFVKFIRYPVDGRELFNSGICTVHSDSHGLYETHTVAFFVIPLLALIIMYTRIAIKLNAREEQRINGRFGRNSITVNTKQLESKRNIVRMLIIIVITFFISWAPFHVQRIIFIYGKHWPNYSTVNENLFAIAGFFYYLSCTINPIIYNAMSTRYRIAFRQTFCCKKQ